MRKRLCEARVLQPLGGAPAPFPWAPAVLWRENFMLPSGTLCELVESLNRRLHFGIPGSHGVMDIESVKEFILLSCLKGPACLGTSRKTDKVRYVFFASVSVCVRGQKS